MEAQELLQDIVFVILYGVVMGLGIAGALYLLLRRSNAIAPEVTPPLRLRRWAAAIMLENVLSHVLWLWYFCHPSITGYVLVCTQDILLLIPIIAGILLSMLQDRHRPVWPVAVALVPVIGLSALNIIYDNEAFLFWLGIYVIALYAMMMVYMYFAVRRYGHWLRDNYADLEHKEVWQSYLVMVVFALFSILYICTSGQTRFLTYLLEFVCIIIMSLVLWRAETLQSLSESTAAEAEKPAEEAQNVSAQQAFPVDIAALLKKHCENAPYNHGLALALTDADGGSYGYFTWRESNTDAGHSKQTENFTKESGLQYNATHNKDEYPAFKAAIANNGAAAPKACSAWFLASAYQWKKINEAGSILLIDADGFKKLLGFAYWSSSEFDASEAWLRDMSQKRNKNEAVGCVRSCLAF